MDAIEARTNYGNIHSSRPFSLYLWLVCSFLNSFFVFLGLRELGQLNRPCEPRCANEPAFLVAYETALFNLLAALDRLFFVGRWSERLVLKMEVGVGLVLICNVRDVCQLFCRDDCVAYC